MAANEEIFCVRKEIDLGFDNHANCENENHPYQIYGSQWHYCGTKVNKQRQEMSKYNDIAESMVSDYFSFEGFGKFLPNRNEVTEAVDNVGENSLETVGGSKDNDKTEINTADSVKQSSANNVDNWNLEFRRSQALLNTIKKRTYGDDWWNNFSTFLEERGESVELLDEAELPPKRCHRKLNYEENQWDQTKPMTWYSFQSNDRIPKFRDGLRKKKRSLQIRGRWKIFRIQWPTANRKAKKSQPKENETRMDTLLVETDEVNSKRQTNETLCMENHEIEKDKRNDSEVIIQISTCEKKTAVERPHVGYHCNQKTLIRKDCTVQAGGKSRSMSRALLTTKPRKFDPGGSILSIKIESIINGKAEWLGLMQSILLWLLDPGESRPSTKINKSMVHGKAEWLILVQSLLLWLLDPGGSRPSTKTNNSIIGSKAQRNGLRHQQVNAIQRTFAPWPFDPGGSSESADCATTNGGSRVTTLLQLRGKTMTKTLFVFILVALYKLISSFG